MTTQRKTFAGVVRTAAPGTIQVIASTGTVDRQSDRVNPRGIQLENFLKNPVIPWSHDYRSLPVGRALEVTATDRDLRAVIQFGPHTFAQEVYGLYRGGFLNAVSIGFSPLEPPKPNEFGGVDFDSTELLEISCVPIPANQEALVIARSMAGLDPGTDTTGRLWPSDDEVIPDEMLAGAVAQLRNERAILAPAAEPGLWHVDVEALRSVIQETIGEAMTEQRCRMTGRLD